MKKLWIVGLGAMLLPLAGCNRQMEWAPVDMWNRSRYKPLEPEPFFANGSSTQAPVAGTVARGQLHTDELLYQGRKRGSGVAPLTVQTDGTNLASISANKGGNNPNGGGVSGFPAGDNGLGANNALATTFPFPITYSVLKRGEDRFNVYCSPCHSRVGDGHGMIVERGFPKPPSFHIERLRKAPVGHYFDVITHGYGAMYPYASRVETRDRWAIIAYIRLLQARSEKYADANFKKAQTEGGVEAPRFKGGTIYQKPQEAHNDSSDTGEKASHAPGGHAEPGHAEPGHAEPGHAPAAAPPTNVNAHTESQGGTH